MVMGIILLNLHPLAVSLRGNKGFFGKELYNAGWISIENLTIACFDVYYYGNYARACCIVFSNSEEEIISEYISDIEGIEEYISGKFYKRELPCILKVIEKVEENIDIIITDSFIWVDGYKKGLGAYLFESINHKIPIIGVAKSYLKGSTAYLKIYRGKSYNPLYVSAIGIDLNYAAKLIKSLKGDFRIPDILKKVDKLSRGTN